jgi:hypothetical protein
VSFIISGLDAAPFSHLFHRSEEELAAAGVMRYMVTDKPGSPCRISLEDVEPGNTVLLLNYTHLDTATPYRASHAIFVSEDAAPARLPTGEIPDSIRIRLLSVRAYDTKGMMLDADVVEGTDLEPAIEQMFGNPSVDFIHLHNARRGCFAARVDRA